MSNQTQEVQQAGCLDRCGCSHIFRALSMSFHPGKLTIALGAVLLTLALGTVLDLLWTASGAGVEAGAIERFVLDRQVPGSHEAQPGDHGIFKVWWAHERDSFMGLVSLSHWDGRCRNLANLAYGVLWMLGDHFFYFILFSIGTLLIWSLGGGAICRMTAVEFATGEAPTMGQGLAFARARLFSGLVPGPFVPLVLVFFLMLLMALAGVVLSIPIAGDLIVGLLFFLSIIAGFLMAALLIGLLAGGSLMFPAVAVEGADAFDVFSRSFSYLRAGPLRAGGYALLAVVCSSVVWSLCYVFSYFALACSRAGVGVGAWLTGWGAVETGSGSITKLDKLWPWDGLYGWYYWPGADALGGFFECFSSACIAVYVMAIVGLMWALAASLYFNASTVVYFLLRRSVDGTDLQDVLLEEEEEEEEKPDEPVASKSASPAPAPAKDAPENRPDDSQGDSTDDSTDDSPDVSADDSTEDAPNDPTDDSSKSN